MGWYGNDGIFLVWLSFGTSHLFIGRKFCGRCQFGECLLKSLQLIVNRLCHFGLETCLSSTCWHDLMGKKKIQVVVSTFCRYLVSFCSTLLVAWNIVEVTPGLFTFFFTLFFFWFCLPSESGIWMYIGAFSFCLSLTLLLLCLVRLQGTRYFFKMPFYLSIGISTRTDINACKDFH